MQFVAEYGLFLAKTLTVVVAVVIVSGVLTALTARQKKAAERRLEVTHLNKHYEQMEQALQGALLPSREFKQRLKARKKADKVKARAGKRAAKSAAKSGDSSAEPSGTAPGKRIYVLNFDGDLRASAVSSLCQEVSAILTMAGRGDEVVVRLESGGGVVHGYGLAASQLRRLRDRGIPLTVAVDKIAASGGYMMACVADKIIAAPFAFIGSIGVLLQMPNLRELLKKHDVVFEQIYSGEYKRTLTLFGENTDKAREKARQQIEETHDLFKAHVKTQRPDLNIDEVATGEYWLGSRALELGLVDQLQTSDDYLMEARRDAQLLALRYVEKQKFIDRFFSLMRAHWPRGGRSGGDLDRPMLL